MDSSEIESRVEDLNQAFANTDISMIQTVIGGFNSGELLQHLNYDLIRRNPKVLVGYSDITSLANAIYAKTGLVTYSGPHFFDFGEKQGFEYTMEYFRKCLFSSDPFDVLPSEKWSNDRWGLAQDQRTFFPNEGLIIANKGEAKGRIIGGNLVTLTSINGSPFFPPLKRDTVLFLEEDRGEDLYTFNRNLNSLILRPDFQNVVGIVIGRFEQESGITTQKLLEVLKYHRELNGICRGPKQTRPSNHRALTPRYGLLARYSFRRLFLVVIFSLSASHSLRPNKSSKLSLRGLLLSIADLITSDNSIEFWILSATVRIRPQATHLHFEPTFTCSKWPHLLGWFLLDSRKSTSFLKIIWTCCQSLIRSPS